MQELLFLVEVRTLQQAKVLSSPLLILPTWGQLLSCRNRPRCLELGVHDANLEASMSPATEDRGKELNCIIILSQSGETTQMLKLGTILPYFLVSEQHLYHPEVDSIQELPVDSM